MASFNTGLMGCYSDCATSAFLECFLPCNSSDMFYSESHKMVGAWSLFSLGSVACSAITLGSCSVLSLLDCFCCLGEMSLINSCFRPLEYLLSDTDV